MGNGWGAPGREQRIAAHRAPKAPKVFGFKGMVVLLWKYNRTLFWQMTAGLFFVGFAISFTVALVIGLLS